MNVPISSLLERKGSAVFSVAPSLTVFEAVAEMNRRRIGAIVVLDGGRLAGIFTERDVLRKVVGVGVDPRTTSVADVMTKDVLTIGPETTTDETMAIFADKRCRRLPVVDGGRLIGVISIGDVSRWIAEVNRAEAEHLRNYIAGGVA